MSRNEQAHKQGELGCGGFTLYGWDGDPLTWESTPAHVDGSFVPVALALRQQPTYEGAYDIDQDPLWTHRPKAKLFDALAWY